jgi:hypothetical protein
VKIDPVRDRSWTPEDVANFLGVPVRTLYQWRYSAPAPKAPESVSTSVTSPKTFSPGSASSRRQRECHRPLAHQKAARRRGWQRR